MSCTLRQIIPRLGPLTGFTPDQIAMAIETARQRPAADDPHPDPAVVDAVLRQAAGHDRQAVTTALRQLLAGLLHLRRRTGARVRSFDPLILAIAERPPADIAASVPMVVARLRSRVFGMAVPDDPPPAPLPVELPEDPNTRQRVVRAAARFAPWTDAEASQIERYPNLVGLAWTLGVDHPRIRAIVAESSEAAVAAIVAGATDPDLVARVLDNPAVSPFHAAEVLIHRPDLPANQFLATVVVQPDAAAEVLIHRPDLPADQLLAAVAVNVWAAAKVVCHRPDLSTDQLLTKVVEEADAWTAAQILIHRPDLPADQLLTKVVEEAGVAAEVLIHRPDLSTDQLLTKVVEEADAWTAAQILIHRPDLPADQLLTKVVKEARVTAEVLIHRPDLPADQLLAAVAVDVWAAARVVCHRPDLSTDQLLAMATSRPDAAAEVLIHRPDLRNHLATVSTVCRNRTAVHTVIDACGPYPALWQRLPPKWQQEVLSRYRCTRREQSWLRGLLRRMPPRWHAADDVIAARFPWHQALRAAYMTRS